MAKILYILKEIFYLIGKHKLAFLAPIFIILALLSFLVYYIGPAVITSFIYAGV
jgi:hypothetical protein